MALIKCPECGQMVSDKAKTCPHCGNPTQHNAGEASAQKIPSSTSAPTATKAKNKTSIIIAAVVAILLIGGGVLYFCLRDTTPAVIPTEYGEELVSLAYGNCIFRVSEIKSDNDGVILHLETNEYKLT